ncbi:hypothetical protein Kpho02_10460 [Kitasatospora phosalacinea]|uniref:DUF4419 domain-containing protein n=1 Tax=Kitasatospora phosalacinea TaxID=2065 RepID=A0A9W6V103_9ACTN|nr:DUF4419 domain-containing protein [Kitasatospora phosalacinea]GLW68747.1 hypothetical protein Kpho02_10460 [Kitasatospora phosalacinea]
MAVDLTLPLAEDPHAAALASRLRELGNDAFLRAAVREPFTVRHRSTDRLLGDPDVRGNDSAASLLVRALHLCFAAHLPLSLSPDVLWYAVVHEVATHVRLNADAYAGVFTDTPGSRRTLVVRDDALTGGADWQRSLHLVQGPLRERIGERVADLFQPAFSTTTPADASAALVALMDVVSPYYDFRWVTRCGIPRVRLEGTGQDWRLLADRVDGLAERFAGLRPWLDALRPVLAEIAATAAGGPVDPEFWGSLYKWESRSGSDRVTGWITRFFAHRYDDRTPVPATADGIEDGHFPAHLSVVPFTWQLPDGERRMAFVGGVLGIERDEEWVRPRLGFAVLHLTAPPLPADWTLDDVRAATGRTDVTLHPGEGVRCVSTEWRPLSATRVLLFGPQEDGTCPALLEHDGLWYPAECVGPTCVAVRPTGAPLAEALRSVTR